MIETVEEFIEQMEEAQAIADLFDDKPGIFEPIWEDGS